MSVRRTCSVTSRRAGAACSSVPPAFALAADKPTCVVLDEIPYLTASTPGFASILQYEWDHRPRDARLLLITSGSAISTMTALSGPRGPLRGRPTDTLHVEQLSAYEARPFLPRLAPGRFIEAYAACGGYPLHLEKWDPRRSTDANLLALAASAGGLLLDDAQSMIQEELAATSTHAMVMSEIGRGRTTFSQIGSALQGCPRPEPGRDHHLRAVDQVRRRRGGHGPRRTFLHGRRHDALTTPVSPAAPTVRSRRSLERAVAITHARSARP